MITKKSFYRCIPCRCAHSFQNLYRLFCQPVSVIGTIRCHSIIFYQCCCTKSVQRLFSKCLPTVLSITYTVECIDKLNNVVNMYPFVGCLTPGHIWFYACHCQNNIATYI